MSATLTLVSTPDFDANSAKRAALITAYVKAGTWRERMLLLQKAAEYDKAHPNEPVRLADEMYGTGLGAAA